jgi:hypothetical protein
MIATPTALFDAPLQNGGASAPTTAGLGLTPILETLTTPIATYS